MKSNKKNRGITLVALIVTVIILLILAGITINTLTNNGLFEKAKEARNRWQNEQNKEEMQIARYSNEIENIISNRNETSYTVTILYEYPSTGPISSGSIIFKDGHTIDEFDALVFFNGHYNSSTSKWSAMESFTFLKDSWNFAIENGQTGNTDEVGFYSYSTDGLRIRNVSKTGFEINTAGSRNIIKIYGIKY